jgi:hypothetical protein
MVGRQNEITAAEIEARLLGVLLHPDQDARDADVTSMALRPAPALFLEDATDDGGIGASSGKEPPVIELSHAALPRSRSR